MSCSLLKKIILELNLTNKSMIAKQQLKSYRSWRPALHRCCAFSDLVIEGSLLYTYSGLHHPPSRPESQVLRWEAECSEMHNVLQSGRSSVDPSAIWKEKSKSLGLAALLENLFSIILFEYICKNTLICSFVVDVFCGYDQGTMQVSNLTVKS